MDPKNMDPKNLARAARYRQLARAEPDQRLQSCAGSPTRRSETYFAQ